MRPYYDHAGITIYHGDCRDILPEIPAGSVDFVLTDPPYGVRPRTGGSTKQRERFTAYASYEDSEERLVAEIIPIIKECISRFRTVACSVGAKNLWFYPRPDGFGVLHQPASNSLSHWGFIDADPILYYGRNPYAGHQRMMRPNSYEMTESPQSNGHPCPKPIRVWRRLVEKLSLPSDTVLDPFMGSGTTLVAAKQLGRRAIGIEIEERYCEIAVKRLAQEVLPMGDDAPAPVQASLLDV